MTLLSARSRSAQTALALLALLTVAACTDVGDASLVNASDCFVPTTETGIDYADQILPLLTRNSCIVCHNADIPQGVNLDLLPDELPHGDQTGGPVIVPCEPAGSVLLLKSTGGCPDYTPFGAKMPQGTDGLSLADSALLQQWIAEGARPTFDPDACP